MFCIFFFVLWWINSFPSKKGCTTSCYSFPMPAMKASAATTAGMSDPCPHFLMSSPSTVFSNAAAPPLSKPAAVAAARSPLVVGDVSGEWVPWPKGSGVDLVDLYMCRIKAQREDSTIEYLVQLFDSIAIAALIDLLS